MYVYHNEVRNFLFYDIIKKYSLLTPWKNIPFLQIYVFMTARGHIKRIIECNNKVRSPAFVKKFLYPDTVQSHNSQRINFDRFKRIRIISIYFLKCVLYK